MSPPGDGRVRALLVAEAANPEWVSVPLVGWSLARALARVTDAHLVTQVRNREAIERAGLGAEDFTPIDTEAVARVVWRLGEGLRGGTGRGWTTVTALASLAYPWFEWKLWRRFGDRIRAGEFDVVHRITPLSPTAPSLLARRCARAGVPFVVGPLNGGAPWPPGFDRERRREREWLSYARRAYRALPGVGSTRRHAAALLVGSRHTLAELPQRARARCVYLPENGIDPERFAPPAPRPPPEPLRVAFLGRLVPYKGADMLLEAAEPLVRTGRVCVDVIGDGPERARLQAWVEARGLGAGIRFHGWIAHDRVRDALAPCHVLGFPSIREFGGGVVLEAMALGLVPLVVDYAGPAELVTEETGVRVALGPREAIVASLREALQEMLRRPETLPERGARARERALRYFSWDAKAAQVLEVYRWVLGERSARPDFGMPLGTGPHLAESPSGGTS